jgi:hypothetical protein
MNKVKEAYKALTLISPKAITATETGSSIDVQVYQGDAMAIFQYGALGGTTETLVGKGQKSVDGGSGWTDVSPTVSSVTGATGDNMIAAIAFQLDPNVTHVRAVITMSGTSSSLVSSVLLARAEMQGATLNSATPS